jgi:hypothetical protein
VVAPSSVSDVDCYVIIIKLLSFPVFISEWENSVACTAEYGALTAVTVKSSVFCDMTPYDVEDRILRSTQSFSSVNFVQLHE